jgi:hypothetical protein
MDCPFGVSPVSTRNYFLAEKWGMAHNGWRLGEGGDFNHKCSYEAHTSNLRKTVIRSTEPPLLPNRCYVLPFFSLVVLTVVNVAS